jgi:hypothetical protein
MKRLVRTTTYGLVAAAALCLASGPSFANEPGDYQPTLAGATIGQLSRRFGSQAPSAHGAP